MDLSNTIAKVKKEYREYLRNKHPDWSTSTLSTHISDAFYLYQNTIALSFWKCFADNDSMAAAKEDIRNYLLHEVMSDRADQRTTTYYRDLVRLKEFLDSRGGVKNYIAMSTTVNRPSTTMSRWCMMARFPLRTLPRHYAKRCRVLVPHRINWFTKCLPR